MEIKNYLIPWNSRHGCWWKGGIDPSSSCYWDEAQLQIQRNFQFWWISRKNIPCSQRGSHYFPANKDFLDFQEAGKVWLTLPVEQGRKGKSISQECWSNPTPDRFFLLFPSPGWLYSQGSSSKEVLPPALLHLRVSMEWNPWILDFQWNPLNQICESWISNEIH